MSHAGNRLEKLRNSLAGKVTARAFCLAVGWEQSRSRYFERLGAWDPAQEAEVCAAVASVMDRTVADDAVKARAIDYVRGKSKEVPWIDPPAWRPGQSPEIRMGRPPRFRASARGLDHAASSPADERPVLPTSLLQEQTATVLRLLAAGKVDLTTAAQAILDIFEPLASYYNKFDGADPTAA